MLTPKILEAFFSGITLPKDAAVLDLGCQNAAALAWLKATYQLEGKLIGIDKRSKDFETPEIQQSLGVSLLERNAAEPLDFPDESFDLIFHCNVLECIPDTAAHLRELHRLLKPGGQIVCVHEDWESIVLNGGSKALIRKAVLGYANFLQAGWMDSCDGWIGRRLWGYCNGSGLFQGEISIYDHIETEYAESMRGWQYIQDMQYFLGPQGFLSEAEYAELLADMEDVYARGAYLYAAPYYVYRGRKIIL